MSAQKYIHPVPRSVYSHTWRPKCGGSLEYRTKCTAITMFKALGRRFKDLGFKHALPPDLWVSLDHHLGEKYPKSISRSQNQFAIWGDRIKDRHGLWLNDNVYEANSLKKNEAPKTLLPNTEATDSTKTGNPLPVEKSKESKPATTETTPPQTTKHKGYFRRIGAFVKGLPWREMAWSICTGIGGFAFLVWKEDLLTKYRLIWIAQDPNEIDDLLLKEWKGLKTDVPIKLDDEVTPLPQWNWMWLLRAVPRAPCSGHLFSQLSFKYQARLEHLQATITPIDFSPIIKKVLSLEPSQFVVLDGQKGTGKSTAMMLLCWHEVSHGKAALFLRLAQDREKEGHDFQCAKAVKNNPSLLEYLAKFFMKQSVPFTIVIDDMHRYLKGEQSKENAAIIIGYLWQVTEFFGVRVIFPTSDYGLKRAILDLPMHHSARFQQVRMYAPAEKELTEMINSGIIGKGHEQMEGNSPADIACYCEVVGTLRELQINYLRPSNNPSSSVRKVTQDVFKNNVEPFRI